MLVNRIDPTPYVRPPRIAADSGLSLAKMLLMMIPNKPGPGVLMAAKLLTESVTTLETVWNGQGKPKASRDVRPADWRVDRAWGAVHARLTAWGIFPDDDPDRQTSAALTERLFPTGLDFLTLSYPAEHAQSERRLQIIEAEGLRDDLDHLVGESFIDELLEAHAAYGEALGITKPAEAPEAKELLVEPLRELGEAIVTYSLQIIAFAALSPDNLAPAKRALLPIDQFRAAASRRNAAGSTDDSTLPEGAPAPDAPMPALPE
ncbi:hypothetical protein [Paraliomyxa miuraensis]|uniref:hypothetical protein n=1 Tax=Paraliomyxa miuraensis TaxID=376150 RepID=UPI0022546EEE|nr:hypothetical protein [Paraliomyxa miuraensis]MCX4242317.1 hypothetical protein [Paraliomyxa miuraensis]